MEEKNKNPSFPSNYVTLVQLQERWLKEKERKQREEEEECQRKLQQEQEQKRKEEEDRKASDRRIEANSKPSNRNGQMQNRRYRRDDPVKEVEVDGGEVADQEGKSERKKKKKKKYKKKGKKPNVEVEKEITGKEEVVSEPPADIAKEDAPARRSGESRRKVVETRAKMKNLPETAEIEAKLGNLSVKNWIEKTNDGLRKTKTQKHGGRGPIGGNRSVGLNRMDGRKQNGAKFVWVKKGEAIDDNVTDNIPANSHFGTVG